MKSSLSVICFATLGLLLPAKSSGEPFPQKGPSIEFDLLVVRIPEAVAVPLIPQLRDRQRSAKATEEILELVSRKKATLVGWPIIATKSGVRAVAEQIEEFRYATEYSGSERIRTTEGRSSEANNPDAPAAPANAQNSAVSSSDPRKIIPVLKEVDAVPCAFETRNIGVTLEIEAVVRDDGKTIDISLFPQHVTLLEMRRVEIEDQKSGRKTVVQQPQFLTNKISTVMDVQNGDYTLLGTFTLKKPEGTIELFILHTQVKGR
jgi:hypothetical protein